jgi:hypothetical protein
MEASRHKITGSQGLIMGRHKLNQAPKRVPSKPGRPLLPCLATALILALKRVFGPTVLPFRMVPLLLTLVAARAQEVPASVESTTDGTGWFTYTFSRGNAQYVWGLDPVGGAILIRSSGMLEIQDPPGWKHTVDDTGLIHPTDGMRFFRLILTCGGPQPAPTSLPHPTHEP